MNSTNTILKWIATAALIGVLFTPLFVANSLFFPFIVGKALWLRLCISIGFGAWALLAIRDNSFLPKKNSILYATTALVVVTLISSFGAENSSKAFFSNFERMEGFFTILYLYLYYIALSSLLKTAAEWRRYIAFSLGAAVMVCYKGLMQLGGLSEIHQSDTRLDATLGNAAYLAVYMLVHIFLTFYMFVGSSVKNIGVYLGYAFLVVNFGIVLFVTAARGSMIGLVAAACIGGIAYVWFDRNQEETARYRYIILGIIAAMFLGVAALFTVRATGIVTLPPILERYTSISWNENKTQARGYIWPIAVTGALERPLFGWGQEGFNYVFNSHYVKDMWRHEQWFDRAHSVFLDWLVAGGFLGFLAYVSLYFFVVRSVVKTKSLKSAEKAALIGFLIAYAVHNVFVFDNNTSYLMFFLMISLASYLSGGEELTELAIVSQQKDVRELIVMPAVVVALCILAYVTIVNPLRANYSLIKGLFSCQSGQPNALYFTQAAQLSPVARQEAREQFLVCATGIVGSPAIPADKQREIVQAAVDGMYEQIKDTPGDARPYLILASSLNRMGQAERALELLATAEKLTPQKHTVYLEKAISFMTLGQENLGVVEAKKAYDMSPEYPEARVMYTLTLLLSDKVDQATTLVKQYGDVRTDRRVIGALISQSQYKLAEQGLDEAILAQPQNSEYRFMLAGVAMILKNPSKALAQATYVLENGSTEDKTKADNVIKEIKLGRNPIQLK